MNIGFICGAFDLLHPGHILHIQTVRKQCDYLKVGLHTNPQLERPEKHAPIQTVFERLVQLRAVQGVDEIIPYDTERDLCNILATEDIQTRFLGSEYRYACITGVAICAQRGIKIIYIPRLHDFSSTELRKRLTKKRKAS